MDFRTKVTIPAFDFSINHSDRMMMMGSCFAENMAVSFRDAGFQIDVNPFGTAYNPLSLASGIRDLMSGKKYAISDLFQHQGLYHSFSHHSRFSGISAEICLENINQRIEASSVFLKNTTILIITYGTASVYILKSNGKTVTNCHKLPESYFIRKRLPVENIVDDWKGLIEELKSYNSNLKLLFTVSPIRHWKDGAHENQLSKSSLLLAIDKLTRCYHFCHYFPSYEILMDELRDYRFYAEDMLHPSSATIEYIWEKFSESFFSVQTQSKIREWRNLHKSLEHKPFNPDSEQYKELIQKTQQKIKDFRF
ncbi:MAG: GSCFA domain-containing protein [Dysgonamonadaceae bacterium]|jgi:hypothetical protein|nr:GSCFA domain-containing protein [Dysgonamonadaceae bacterium]